MGTAALEAGEADQVEHLPRLLAPNSLWLTLEPQPECDVLDDR